MVSTPPRSRSSDPVLASPGSESVAKRMRAERSSFARPVIVSMCSAPFIGNKVRLVPSNERTDSTRSSALNTSAGARLGGASRRCRTKTR